MLGILIFQDMKGKTFTRLTNLGWMCDLALFLCIPECLNDQMSNLQETNQLINQVSTKIKSFEIKVRLWELQLRSNNMAHFPALRTEKPTGTNKHAEEIPILQQELRS
jgi:hypothetical protein